MPVLPPVTGWPPHQHLCLRERCPSTQESLVQGGSSPGRGTHLLPSNFRVASLGKRCQNSGSLREEELTTGHYAWRGIPFPHSLTCCRVQRHPFERIATPFQVYSWTAPQAEHAMDCVRAEDAYTSRLGYEEHIPGQVLPGPALPASLPGARLLLCIFRRLPISGPVHREVEEGVAQSRSGDTC